MMTATTTWCRQHERLEQVEAVDEAKSYVVAGVVVAVEVHGSTTTGCRVHFMGGERWRVSRGG